MRSRTEALAWEERWALPVAIATLLAVVLSIAGSILVGLAVGGSNGEAEYLRHVDQHRAMQIAATVVQAIGAFLLAVPLTYLFRADQARSEKVRGQMIGLVIAGPIFLGVFYVLLSLTVLHGASEFVGQAVTGTSTHADNLAKEAVENAPLRGLTAGFEVAGRLGFAIAMFYPCLYGLRTGLLSRFWGALGMAMAAVGFLFPQFAIFWFIYFGLLVGGWVPGGRPPAWAAGEAIRPPSPGERVAAEIEPKDDDDESDRSRGSA